MLGYADTSRDAGPLHSATTCPAVPLQDRRCAFGLGGTARVDGGLDDTGGAVVGVVADVAGADEDARAESTAPGLTCPEER